jgi:hypothetical protein
LDVVATFQHWDGAVPLPWSQAMWGGVIDVDWGKFLSVLLSGLSPVLPQFALIAAAIIVISAPLPGRGPGLFPRQDPWRCFKYGARDVVMSRAGHRCEGAVFVAWGRCKDAATDADHVYPWVRGGPTVPSNGQALCRGHNKHKGAMRPPWWYLLTLEHRRRSYFPPGTDVRVSATISGADRDACASTPVRKPRR